MEYVMILVLLVSLYKMEHVEIVLLFVKSVMEEVTLSVQHVIDSNQIMLILKKEYVPVVVKIFVMHL